MPSATALSGEVVFTQLPALDAGRSRTVQCIERGTQRARSISILRFHMASRQFEKDLCLAE
jgi:hypothetical protein